MPLALTGSSTPVKDKRSYKEVQELLLLHRRYEEKALRLFRKGLSDEETPDMKRQPHAQSTANTLLSNGSVDTRGNLKYSSKLHRKNLTKPLHHNDNDYLEHLLFKNDANGNFVDRSVTQSKWEDNNSRAQLRLPKLEGIPPENKEIFYTALPKMPPLPKLKETKVKAIKPPRKKKRSWHNSRKELSSLSSETCLTIRQLPRDHFMLHDFGNGANSSSSISNVPRFTRITTRPIERDLSSEAITSDEGRLWLVPIVDIEIPSYRLAKWNEIENGSLSIEEDKRRELQQLKGGAGSDKRAIEDSQPNYKRNVHFSEFLHEIHLYSPISTAQSARSREDI